MYFPAPRLLTQPKCVHRELPQARGQSSSRCHFRRLLDENAKRPRGRTDRRCAVNVQAECQCLYHEQRSGLHYYFVLQKWSLSHFQECIAVHSPSDWSTLVQRDLHQRERVEGQESVLGPERCVSILLEV